MKKKLMKSLALAFVGSLIVAGSAMATPGPLSLSWDDGRTVDPAGDISGSIDLSAYIDFDMSEFISNALITVNTIDPRDYSGGNPIYFDFTFGTQESGGQWDSGDYQMDLDSAALADLSTDGILQYTVHSRNPAAWGDTEFIVDSIQFDGNVALPNPEPATMLLFGTGLTGLAGLTRRKKKVSA